MKKVYYIFFLLVVASFFYFVWNKPDKGEMTPKQILHQGNATNLVVAGLNDVETRKDLFVANDATNLVQWQAAISGLKKLGGFVYDQRWLVEQPGRTNGIPLLLRVGSKQVVFKSVMTDIAADNVTGAVREAEMQSEKMDVDETKRLGVQICELGGINPSDFVAWCDRVGNRQGENDLYAIRGRNGIGFRMLHSFNDSKPWCINLVLTP